MTDKEYDQLRARLHKANVLRQRMGIAKQEVKRYTHMEGVFLDHDGRKENATNKVNKWIKILNELRDEFRRL